jgi:DNA-directed RNA polymerase specialized sigma24 family protein
VQFHEMSIDKVLREYGADSEEFALKLDRYLRYVVNRHYGRSHDPEAFADAAGEAYAKILSRLREVPFDPSKGDIKNYLYTIVRNEVSNLNYRDRRRGKTERTLHEESEGGMTDPALVHRHDYHVRHESIEDLWRTLLGAYVAEAEGLLARLGEGAVEPADLRSYPQPRAVEALRVHLWRSFQPC